MELDFRREAEAIKDLREALGHREDVLIPEVVEGMNTERLLVMEFVEGVKITDREGLVNAGLDPHRVAGSPSSNLVEVTRNLFVSTAPCSSTSVTVDLVEAMKEAIEALTEGDFDTLTGALQKAGLEISDLDLDTLLGLVGVLFGSDQTGEEDGQGDGEGTDLPQFGLKLGASIGHIPNDLLLVGRAIGLIDGITRQLDPDVDTIEIVARYAQDV